MRDESSVFQRVIAERPARSPSRKPPRVSPRGVLIDIPVIATRRSVGKVHLRDGERADRLALQDLTRDRGRELVPVDDAGEDMKGVAALQLPEEAGVADGYGAEVARDGVGVDVVAPALLEMEETDPELSHDLDLEDPRIDGLAREVTGEDGIVRVEPPRPGEGALLEVESGELVHEQERLAVAEDPADRVAAERNVARRGSALPERAALAPLDERVEGFTLHGRAPSRRTRSGRPRPRRRS